MIFNLAWIAGGGAVGSVLRFSLTVAVQRLSGALFPFGTMLVNVTGCVAIGFLSERLEASGVAPHVRLGLLVGLLGGFTTYSTFSLETLRLAEDGELGRALVNAGATLVLCLTGCWLGLRLARGLMG